jgi:hypothetical protein
MSGTTTEVPFATTTFGTELSSYSSNITTVTLGLKVTTQIKKA